MFKQRIIRIIGSLAQQLTPVTIFFGVTTHSRGLAAAAQDRACSTGSSTGGGC